MKKILTLLLFVSLCVGININIYASEEEYKSDEIIVVYKDSLSATTIKKNIISKGATIEDVIPIEDNKAYVVEIEGTVNDAIKEFNKDSKVLLVQPNYKYNLNEETTYYDPGYQYQFDTLRVTSAWDFLKDIEHTTTKVAVIDTGVDVYQEDLQKTLKNHEYYIQTLNGKQIKTDEDTSYHGTHVAGIIGATYGNKIGVAGIASGYDNDLSEIMVIGSSEDGDSLYTSDIVDAINYAVENGAQVVNMSFGGYGRDRVMEEAMKAAYNEGVVLVAASGNEEDNYYTSPSDFREVISVNASNEAGVATYYSNYGDLKDITAPGNAILSTFPGDSYQRLSGTSMASPMITGIVALMLDANPNLTPAEVYNIICGTASNNGTFNDYTAYGIANAREAVEAAYNLNSEEPVDSIEIKIDKVEVYQDDTYSLEYLTKPVTTSKSIDWTSDDDDIATVTPTGEVLGVSPGKTTITATVDGQTATAEVTVKEIVRQTGIEILNKENYTEMTKNNGTYLDATIMPKNATNKEMYWSSSDRSVVTVDEEGYIVTKGVGTATITVTTYDRMFSDSFTINVVKPAKKVKFTSSVPTLLVGEKYTFEAEALNDLGTTDLPEIEKEFMFTSTNENVATVDEITGEVTALKPGVTYIEASVKSHNEVGYPVKKVTKLTVGKTKYTTKDYGLKLKTKTYNSITLKWNKIAVASGYVLERRTANTSYKVVKNITNPSTLSYKDTNLNTNTNYYYRIKAIYKNPLADKVLGYHINDISSNVQSLGYSNYIIKTPTLNKPIIKASIYNTNKIKVTWNKVSGASGYIVYKSREKSKNYVKLTTIKNSSTLSYIDQNPKQNIKYYYKVKAYRVNPNGNYAYGQASLSYAKMVK